MSLNCFYAFIFDASYILIALDLNEVPVRVQNVFEVKLFARYPLLVSFLLSTLYLLLVTR